MAFNPPDDSVLVSDGAGNLTVAGLTLDGAAGTGHFVQTILFSDLGAGASDTIDLATFPTNVIFRGCAIEINTAFAGEADLDVAIGFTGGDVDALVAAFQLNAVAAGWAAITSGVVHAGTWAADWEGDTLAALFTATELNDVSAGSLTVHIWYDTPELNT